METRYECRRHGREEAAPVEKDVGEGGDTLLQDRGAIGSDAPMAENRRPRGCGRSRLGCSADATKMPRAAIRAHAWSGCRASSASGNDGGVADGEQPPRVGTGTAEINAVRIRLGDPPHSQPARRH